MKKIFVFFGFIFCFLFSQLSGFSMTLSGGVTYSVDDARKIAFQNVQYRISMDPYKKYMTDPGFTPPKKPGGKPKIKRLWREVTFFSDGTYCTHYFGDNIVYYYNKNGKLEFIEIGDFLSNYSITKSYTKDGVFEDLNFRQYYKGKSYIYIFDKNKNYTGKWIDDLFYEPDGQNTLKQW